VSNSRSVLIVTERHLFPPHQGYRARIIELIRSLRAGGWRVVLVSRTIPGWRARLRTRLLVDDLISVDAAGFPGGRLDAYDCSPFLPAVARAVRRFAAVAVIAECPWMAPTLDAVPDGVARVIDTLDLMHVRGAMYGGLDGGAWVECTREEEAHMLGRADIVIAIQRNELDELRAMVPGATVVLTPHPCQLTATRREKRRHRDIVSFVGSDNPGNVRGLRAFVRTAWPAVRERRPAAELRVHGAVARHLGGSVPGITLVGPVRRVERAYARAKVVVNPVTLGTGLKIKTVEALARGRALVTTSCGADGLEDGAGEAFVVADDMDGFAAAVARLLADDRFRLRLEASARAYAAHRFSREESVRELLGALSARAATASRERG